MTELTEREKKIILIKYIVHGTSPFSEAPLEVRLQMLQGATKILGMKYDDQEMLEIGNLCLHLQSKVNAHGMEFLKKHPEEVKIAAKRTNHGNDPISLVHKVKDNINKALGKDNVFKELEEY